MNNKTVLLTGGAGFIGHHTVEHILKHTDWNIIIMDRLSYAGNLNRLTDIGVWWDNQHRTKFFYHDFKGYFDESKVFQLIDMFGNIDYIIHMGANSHVDKSIQDPYPFLYDNVLGTVNMLELADSLRVDAPSFKSMIYVSTDEIYGPVEGDHLHKEDEMQKPGNPYSASKASGENFCMSYYNTYGTPVIISRTMNNYGERQDGEKFLPKVVNSILNGSPVTVHCKKDGKGNIIDVSSRCWLHARNHADALLFLLDKGELGEIYNVVGEHLYVTQLANKVANIINMECELYYEDFHSFRPGHDMHYGLDGTKLKELGWEPPYSLDNSLEKTVTWMINNPKWL